MQREFKAQVEGYVVDRRKYSSSKYNRSNDTLNPKSYNTKYVI